ncbi:MAG TPA: hypothetical protein VFN67_35425 [Polyangiales bacterium]|nr:hypothetical protein [Polyangiales bacterium]
MALTIHAFALGTMVVVSLGCNPRADAKPALAPAQSPNLEYKTEPLRAEPARPSAAPAASSALCLAVCSKASGLHCSGAEECSSGCQEMLSIPNCQTVMVAFLECLSKEPLDHWECDNESHMPAIRDGYCEAQQHDVARCVKSAP